MVLFQIFYFYNTFLKNILIKLQQESGYNFYPKSKIEIDRTSYCIILFKCKKCIYVYTNMHIHKHKVHIYCNNEMKYYENKKS